MGSKQEILPGCGLGVGSQAEAETKQHQSEARVGKPRYEVIEREQLCWRVVDVERLIGPDHAARAVWEFSGQLDLSAYQEEVRAVEGKAGRPGWEPRVLVSLGVEGYSKGVGAARGIEE